MRSRLFFFLTAILICTAASSASGQLIVGTAKRAQPKAYVPGGDASLLDRDYVRRDLALTKEQDNKIKAELVALGVLQRDLFLKQRKAKLPAAGDYPAWFDEIWKPYNDLSAKLVTEVLTDAQRSRFKQIVYQSSGPEPFFRDEVRKELQINANQLQEIGKLFTVMADERKKGLAKTREQGIEWEKGHLERAVQLLNDDQRKKWSTLIGRPIEVK